jgi:D-3-phosphoglycerate dehydrogenase
MKFNVLLYEPIHEEGMRILQERCRVILADSVEEPRLLERVGEIDGIIIRAKGAVTRRIMEAAPRLKVVGRHGVGLDNVDLKAAAEMGIRVVYTPQANAQSVAEHFTALVLALAKRLFPAHRALCSGRFQYRYEVRTVELQGKILGVLGFGRIGQATARICKRGFGMEVLYYDVVQYPELEEELGVQRVELSALFREADVISINLPLLPETRGLVNAELIRTMKPSGLLINMARGPIWREVDVVRALREGWIAGAAADVFEEEPPSVDNPLLRLENFIGTPHMAAHSEEAMVRMSMVAKDILAVLEGKEPEFPVPFSLYPPGCSARGAGDEGSKV